MSQSVRAYGSKSAGRVGTGATVLSTDTNLPSTVDVWAESMMSRTCRPSSPVAMCGRSSGDGPNHVQHTEAAAHDNAALLDLVPGLLDLRAVGQHAERFDVGDALR